MIDSLFTFVAAEPVVAITIAAVAALSLIVGVLRNVAFFSRWIVWPSLKGAWHVVSWPKRVSRELAETRSELKLAEVNLQSARDQRDAARFARDTALSARDQARSARDQACSERDNLLAAPTEDKQAFGADLTQLVVDVDRALRNLSVRKLPTSYNSAEAATVLQMVMDKRDGRPVDLYKVKKETVKEFING